MVDNKNHRSWRVDFRNETILKEFIEDIKDDEIPSLEGLTNTK
jgi:hypothetical protein